jgi:hypothetical protein
MNKRLVIESVIIVIIASAIGITYNAFIKEPIPLIYKEKPKVAVADSLLFSSINEAPQEIVYDEPQIKDNVDSVKTKAKKDTCEKVDLIENETEEEIVRKPEKTEQYASTEITASNKKGKLFGHLKEFNNWVSLEQVKKPLGCQTFSSSMHASQKHLSMERSATLFTSSPNTKMRMNILKQYLV